MRATAEVVVTLTADLWREFGRRSTVLDVPIEWLIAGLVCDTVEDPGRSHGLGAIARQVVRPSAPRVDGKQTPRGRRREDPVEAPGDFSRDRPGGVRE